MPSLLHKVLIPKILGAIVAASCAFWVFIETAENVVDGDTRHYDTEILIALHRSDPTNVGWFVEIVRDISGLGGIGVLGILVLVSTIFLTISKKPKTAIFLVLATFVGAVICSLLKIGFDRPRPDLIPHLTYVYSMSFPSGHAMVSTVVYLTLCSLLARVVSGFWSKIFVMLVGILLAGLVGLSRLYLGVHWPSDVLAGWAAGSAWALACWLMATILNLENERKS
ncbi:MAG TPA: phosphatase PAP2 family protein [Methylophilus sp.]|nr:phosphatase PAP2 family protein [Methylophilus sp.]HQQ33302.1 phosphatase PAP2 family protein [Methylophilus sp.]